MNAYTDFILSKMRAFQPAGFNSGLEMSENLFPHQSAIAKWALRMGRCAIFADAGLGKTRTQLEWARHVAIATNKPVLIFAPLTVARQTMAEGEAMGVGSEVIGQPALIVADRPGIYLTNYDRFERFRDCGDALGGLVLDESSILKSVNGKVRGAMLESYQMVPYRLACTATPAPNDITEIANHSEFLGIKRRAEMLATWFVHDDEGWRLKKHATADFYRWLASWSVYLRKPSDLGFPDTGYDLPPLSVRQVSVECEDRVEATAALIESDPDESWIVWCGLNDESDALEKRLYKLGDSLVRVEGSTSEHDKAERIDAFCRGDARVLVTKPRVCGFGLNLQVAARQVFCGIGDSWEQYYQCLRRSWRFGQAREVIAYVVTSEMEDSVVSNVLRKEEDAKRMGDQIIANVKDLECEAVNGAPEISLPPGLLSERSGGSWRLIHGDCVEAMEKKIEPDSIDLSVFSPPFATLYTYSDNPRDMGNSANHEEFFGQFEFFTRGLLRATRQGRLACVHVAQIPTSLNHDGMIGINDFRGQTIRSFQAAGWVFYREFCIDKCPQVQAIRTHSKALLFVQKEKDRSWSGPALADYVLVFRKPGENLVPINSKEVSNNDWIEWARPIWYGIKETNTLNASEGRGENDERHICPLQLQTIERCVKLWSNPGELVFSPFAGIGSEGFGAILAGRRFVGSELKPEYFRTACKNLKRAENKAQVGTLFEEGI